MDVEYLTKQLEENVHEDVLIVGKIGLTMTVSLINTMFNKNEEHWTHKINMIQSHGKDLLLAVLVVILL